MSAARDRLAFALRDTKMVAYEDGAGGWLYRERKPIEQADALLARGVVAPPEERSSQNDVPACGARPPYSVIYIDPEVCGTRTHQWFVMGTVEGDPRNQCGPVAVCEYEPSAHVIAALLNASGGASLLPEMAGRQVKK